MAMKLSAVCIALIHRRTIKLSAVQGANKRSRSLPSRKSSRPLLRVSLPDARNRMFGDAAARIKGDQHIRHDGLLLLNVELFCVEVYACRGRDKGVA